MSNFVESEVQKPWVQDIETMKGMPNKELLAIWSKNFYEAVLNAYAQKPVHFLLRCCQRKQKRATKLDGSGDNKTDAFVAEVTANITELETKIDEMKNLKDVKHKIHDGIDLATSYIKIIDATVARLDVFDMDLKARKRVEKLLADEKIACQKGVSELEAAERYQKSSQGRRRNFYLMGFGVVVAIVAALAIFAHGVRALLNPKELSLFDGLCVGFVLLFATNTVTGWLDKCAKKTKQKKKKNRVGSGDI
jgi:hypothetical protein